MWGEVVVTVDFFSFRFYFSARQRKKKVSLGGPRSPLAPPPDFQILLPSDHRWIFLGRLNRQLSSATPITRTYRIHAFENQHVQALATDDGAPAPDHQASRRWLLQGKPNRSDGFLREERHLRDRLEESTDLRRPGGSGCIQGRQLFS